MGAGINIYSSTHLAEARGDLEEDLEEALGDAISVTGGGAGPMGWNIDLKVAENVVLEDIVPPTMLFLRRWRVPEDAHIEVSL